MGWVRRINLPWLLQELPEKKSNESIERLLLWNSYCTIFEDIKGKIKKLSVKYCEFSEAEVDDQ